MQIGELARLAGVAVDTVRYYERRELLAPARRRASGYRDYDDGDLQRLRFIRRAQALGFTLEEIRQLLRLNAAGGDRREVRELAQARLADVEARLQELQSMRDTLCELVGACSGHGSLAGCPIIERVVGTPQREQQAPDRQPAAGGKARATAR